MPNATIAEESERRIFMETIREPAQNRKRTLKDCGKHGIASRRNCIARNPENYGETVSEERFPMQLSPAVARTSASADPKRRGRLPQAVALTRRRTPSRRRPGAAGRSDRAACPARAARSA